MKLDGVAEAGCKVNILEDSVLAAAMRRIMAVVDSHRLVEEEDDEFFMIVRLR